MRLTEPVTIYLAIGASFGVSRYLCAASLVKGGPRRVAEGVMAALLWPLVAAAILIKRLRHKHWKDDGAGPDAGVHDRVEEAVRTFVITINNMLEAVPELPEAAGQSLEQRLYAMRESARQYAGLSMIEAGADEGAQPPPYEAELARVSGRRGEDLLIAARCVHRRNVSRIKAQYQRERSRLLKTLAELRAEAVALSCGHDDSSAENLQLAEARLGIYLRAANLFSLLEDERAAGSTAKLIDAERLALRRLREAEDVAACSPGEEKCTEQQPQLILKDQLRATTFTRG